MIVLFDRVILTLSPHPDTPLDQTTLYFDTRRHLSTWVNGKSHSAADKDTSGAGGREKNDRAAPWVGRAGPTFPLSVDWHESV